MDDPEVKARAQMAEAERQIIAGVERLGAAWVERTILQLQPELVVEAHAAGAAATARVVGALNALFALDPAEQRATPLEIVRSLRREATAVLQEAHVPPRARDPFETRAFPDDIYAIVPRDLATLGDEELGVALLAWGLGKAAVLRARSEGYEGS